MCSLIDNKEIDLLFSNRVSEGDINIFGGTTGEDSEDTLSDFVDKWNFRDMHMPFAILETIKEIEITKGLDTSKIDPYTIERIRIFGKGGDLDIRRVDNNQFLWRYVGNEEKPEKAGGKNFWETEDSNGMKFFVEEQYALLWGKYDQKRSIWHDDRVAKAKLSYPINASPERVKISYKMLSKGGVVSFIWLTGIYGGEE
ncbi:MAG: hypothetical protein SWO11_17755 [Thermodesulfobacteriota bacterium]|nr:hypothetical protein [Thermodesulfobacteriota bacterium]